MFIFLGLLFIIAMVCNYIVIRFQNHVDEEKNAECKKRAEKAKEDWKKAHFDRKVEAVKAKAQAKKINGKKI